MSARNHGEDSICPAPLDLGVELWLLLAAADGDDEAAEDSDWAAAMGVEVAAGVLAAEDSTALTAVAFSTDEVVKLAVAFSNKDEVVTLAVAFSSEDEVVVVVLRSNTETAHEAASFV